MGFQRPHTPSTNVPFKFSDGTTIGANRESLAERSEVFEKMFNSEFKEKTSSVIPLPADNLKTIKQLLDIIYKGGCEMDGLDDIIPLMEVVDRYQFNKAPFLHMCGEAILSQLDFSNYFTLLPKYVNVMSEESHKKAADKVMSYTNNDFVTKFDETKDLPEEIMLLLLDRNDIKSHEIDIFSFLVKWHEHQTRKPDRSLQKGPQLFQCVRYPLIIPQLLSTVLTNCDLVDRQTLSKAFQYLYGSCRPIGEDDEKMQVYLNHCSRRPNCSLKVEWLAQRSVKLIHDDEEAGQCKIEYHRKALGDDQYILMSTPFKNGVYSFHITPGRLRHIITESQSKHVPVSYHDDVCLNIIDQHGKCLCTIVLEKYGLVTLYIHNNYLFLNTFGIIASCQPYVLMDVKILLFVYASAMKRCATNQV
ncbi:kelch repeat and BTB domain-containing protein 8-like [Dysidea avara]|uniref:kelch repeat and BTB domain-containing protein 8-like n=1 Tax=Dysidea avara TaxID=196820 RepID=UPI00332AC990